MVFDDETQDWVPRLAASLEPNADFSEWTMGLRPGVRFGNGHPLDANAVKASIDRFRDPANRAVFAAFVAGIADIRIVSPTELVFELTEPWPSFPALLADAPGMIADASVVDEKGGYATFGNDPTGAGAGPFELQRWAPGEEMLFTAKDDYYGGEVCVDRLRFVPMSDYNTMKDAFENGEIDAGSHSSPIMTAELRDAGVQNFTSVQNMQGALLINHKPGAPTADVRVRRAVAAALDVDVLNDRVREGKGVATSAMIAEPSRYYQGLDGPAHDPDLARRLVQEVKAEGSWDGSIELLCTTGNEENSITIAGMLEAVGFDVRTENVLVNDMLARVFGTGNFQLNCWGLAAADTDIYRAMLQNFASTSPGNVGGYENPEMDAAIAQLKAAATEAETKAALARLQQIFTDTIPMIFTNGGEIISFWADDVEGFAFSQRLVALFDRVSVG